MMWMTLLDIIIVIMAFVFVVLTDATIEEESAIIGTLLASGYRRREIVLHYLALPAIVGVLAALLGTALGVVFFTEPCEASITVRTACRPSRCTGAGRSL